MPKFLDRPTWYDNYGNTNASVGVQELEVNIGTVIEIYNLSPGIYKLKFVGDGSASGSVGFSLGNGTTINAAFAMGVQAALLNNVWFVLGEQNTSMAANILSQKLTFYNMSITSAGTTNTLANMTIFPSIGRSFSLQLNFMSSGGSPSMYGASITAYGYDIKFADDVSSQNTQTLYFPTDDGESGDILVASGNFDAATWKSISMNGESFGGNATEFYAPTTVGDNGYILKSNGSGAPSWSTPFSITSATSISTSNLGDHCFAVFTADDENTISYGELTGMKVIFMVKHLSVQFPDISAVGISSSGAVKYYHYDQDDFTIVGESRTLVSSVIFSFSH